MSRSAPHEEEALARGNPQLRTFAEHLSAYGWAAELLDPRWRLVWLSPELVKMYGQPDPELAGVGHHILVNRARGIEAAIVSRESAEEWMRLNGPFMLAAAGEDRDQMLASVEPELGEMLAGRDPQPAPALWTSTFDFAQGEFFGRVNYVGQRLHDDQGELVGFAFIYAIGLPGSVAALLTRGHRAMHERMAALVKPSRRSAAVLFADLEGSGALSRRLPSSAYFELIRGIRTALEEAVAERGGILGTHAGDGISACFLTEQLDSPSRAARAAIETGRCLTKLASEIASRLAAEGSPVEPASCRLKVGLHWGPGLYIGQVARQGRLEITALGDEMNEAARIEQSAKGDEVLASKALVERLDEADASALGVDPSQIAYRALREQEGATDKAVRDAGWIPVADVGDAALQGAALARGQHAHKNVSGLTSATSPAPGTLLPGAPDFDQ